MSDSKRTDRDARADEIAFDALIGEVIGGPSPPDLSNRILLRLGEQKTAAHVGGAVSVQTKRVETARHSSSTVKWLAIAAALAAALLIGFFIRGNRELDGTPIGPVVAGTNKGGESTTEPIDAPESKRPAQSSASLAASGTPDQDSATRSVKRNRGVPLVIDLPTGAVETNTADSNALRPMRSETNRTVSQPITLVSQQVGQGFRDYWDSIGIKPSPDADARSIAARLAASLGVEFSPEDLSDVDSIRNRLGDRVVAAALAGGWLEQISSGGSVRLDAAKRNELVGKLAESFAGEQSFDELLSKLISGRHPSSSAFVTAMAQGSRETTDGKLASNLASLTMNVDLRCTRCHDSYIEGSGRQEDYWAFTAFLSRGLRFTDGAWLVQNRLADEPIFYDLPDGRKRVAPSSVTQRWMAETDGDADGDPIESMGQWSGRLLGSRALARGVVNSLWELVHGQPLRGRVVDPVSAPHHETLGELEATLSDDLVASRFDVGRTLALILASPATRRSVPQSMRNVWAIENEDDRNAAGAFAAAMPIRTNLSLKRRLDEVIRSIGGKVNADSETLLAQIGETQGKAKGSSTDQLSWDFPDRASQLPLQWLESIEDRDDRVAHLAYLAGRLSVPESVSQAVSAMRQADVDEATILSRVWWLVR